MDFAAFVNWERSSRDTIDVKKIYIDMADDLVAGIMLSQIVYWYLPSKDGSSKISIIKNDKEWLAKARHDWWDECRISPKQVDRAIKILVDRGILEVKLFKFNNTPTKHIRIVKDRFLTLWQELISTNRENPFLPKGQNGNSPKGEIQDFTDSGKSITETTPETTEKNTNKESSAPVRKFNGVLAMHDQYRDHLGKVPPLLEDQLALVGNQLNESEVMEFWQDFAENNGKSWRYCKKIANTIFARKGLPIPFPDVLPKSPQPKLVQPPPPVKAEPEPQYMTLTEDHLKLIEEAKAKVLERTNGNERTA